MTVREMVERHGVSVRTDQRYQRRQSSLGGKELELTCHPDEAERLVADGEEAMFRQSLDELAKYGMRPKE